MLLVIEFQGFRDAVRGISVCHNVGRLAERQFQSTAHLGTTAFPIVPIRAGIGRLRSQHHKLPSSSREDWAGVFLLTGEKEILSGSSARKEFSRTLAVRLAVSFPDNGGSIVGMFRLPLVARYRRYRDSVF
jgi:hypothetical protein